MSKHTPGPWKAEQAGADWFITGQDRDDDPYSGTVVFMDAGVNGEANARLIAATPDLLAACEDAANRIYTWHAMGGLGTDYGLCPESDDCVQCSIVRLLRAAIAKAGQP